jgi:hypothetical protein
VPRRSSEAMRTDTRLPLFARFGAGLTELANAYLIEPRIADRLTTVWIGGPSTPTSAFPTTRRQRRRVQPQHRHHRRPGRLRLADPAVAGAAQRLPPIGAHPLRAGVRHLRTGRRSGPEPWARPTSSVTEPTGPAHGAPVVVPARPVLQPLRDPLRPTHQRRRQLHTFVALQSLAPHPQQLASQ